MKLVSFLRTSVIEAFFEIFRIRRKPVTLQLPVTNRCNSRCKTCNVWTQEVKRDINPDLLLKVLKDPLFSDLQCVGINGGELTLVKDIDKIIDVILQCEKIKMIWLISNCLLPERLLELLEKTVAKCRKKDVKLGITFSVDGIKEKDNFIRGVPVAYERAMTVLRAVSLDPERYCDICDIGCTVSKYNADDLAQIDVYLQEFKIPIYFHLAVPNKRIGTFESEDYSVVTNKHACQIAAEFFFGLFLKERNWEKKLKYWANYYYLTSKPHTRLTTCDWLYRNVTIDENLDFFLCATASERIGSLLEENASELITSSKCRSVECGIRSLCSNCIHYSYRLSLKGYFIFLKYYLVNFYFENCKYKIGILWQKLR